MELRNDSVYVSQKELTKTKDQAKFKFNYLNPTILATLPVSPKPDYAINHEFPGVELGFNLEDTASIFSGPCFSTPYRTEGITS